MSRNSPAETDAPSRSNYGERVIRRSFRIGLMVGLLGGLALALAKMLGSRPSQQADVAPVPTDPWPPLRDDLATSVAPRAAPTAPPATVPNPPPPIAPTPAAPTAAVAATPSVEAAKPAPAAKPTKVPGAAKTTKTAKPAPAAKAAKTTQSAKALKPAAASAPRKKALTARWVAPTGDVCPTSHPVKAKLASKIFHLPGMLNYDRTKPDRCYLDGSSAEADGLRAAKR